MGFYALVSGLSAACLVLLWHGIAWRRGWSAHDGWKKPILMAVVAAAASAILPPAAGLLASGTGLGWASSVAVVCAVTALALLGVGRYAFASSDVSPAAGQPVGASIRAMFGGKTKDREADGNAPAPKEGRSDRRPREEASPREERSKRRERDERAGLPDADAAYETLSGLLAEREKRVDTRSDADKIEAGSGRYIEKTDGNRVPASSKSAVSFNRDQKVPDFRVHSSEELLDLAFGYLKDTRQREAADALTAWLHASWQDSPSQVGMIVAETCAALRDSGRVDEVAALLSGPWEVCLSDALKNAILRNIEMG